ncbi:sphingomyelin phosphodiesterase [Photobacterium sp. 2_MG-2023]|uniref:sphingomyelin phosphodiesterase n=1 Tax=Photobacterium sp. 2_MG-2023 TaxID=3062663 RepID=UPI0026E18158|nr:sphingomyelin phosphodiesterase [Photobacterium sp. 2_MG-2023]MDO6582152.1 sphingomyelin phosphodiesterase [Photobacterium sp. 2_MG-2023]
MKKTIGTTLLLLSSFTQAESLNVMAYNTLLLSFGDWDQTNRAQRIPAAISALENIPDVLIINEAFNPDSEVMLNELASLYPYQTPVVGLDCSGRGWDALTGDCSNSIVVVRGGVSILSRYPIVSQKAHVYHTSDNSTWDYYSNKGFAYVEIDKNGQRFHLLGTHLQSSTDNPDKEHPVRMAQLTEMQNFISAQAIPTSEPVIIAGDLNVEWSRQDQIADMLATTQSHLFFPEPSTGSFSAKYNWVTKSGAYRDGYSLNYNDTLDYVLWHQHYLQPTVPAAMKVVKLQADEQWYWHYLKGKWPLPEGEYWHNGYYSDLSDHYPVQAEFVFPDQ